MAPPNLGSSEEVRTRYLIALVKERPAIYNKSLPEYTNPEVKRRLWNEIGEKIYKNRWDKWKKAERRESILFLQKRWGNLRTTFSRELKNYIKAKREGGDPDSKKKYVHFDRMKFIMNHIIIGMDGQQKPAVEYLADEEVDNHQSEEQQEDFETHYLDEASLLEEEYNEKASDGEVEYLETEMSPIIREVRTERSSTGSMEKKRKNMNHTVTYEQLEDENGKNDTVTYHQLDDDSSIDQDVNFALSLVPMLRELPRNKKLQAQIEVLKVFQRLSN
ncbi:alcohol dehydrogenase transcription factor myb/SANT-like domain-containing protein [Phthorimaea operculella]|nr:alcohol dehydrogenase transcription factor myb/SANT-like domain-containing protein [Phthorimaea operculella]